MLELGPRRLRDGRRNKQLEGRTPLKYLVYTKQNKISNIAQVITENPLETKRVSTYLKECGFSDNYKTKESLTNYIQQYNHLILEDDYRVQLWTEQELDNYKVSLL